MENESLLAAMHASPFAVWLRSSLAYPVLEIVHIVGLGTLLGTLLIVDLALMGVIRRVGAGELARTILPWTLVGFALAAVSGLTMFFARAGELISNSAFVLKMALVMTAGCNAAWLHGRGPLDAASAITRVQAGLSLVIWVAVVACGRWIAYL